MRRLIRYNKSVKISDHFDQHLHFEDRVLGQNNGSVRWAHVHYTGPEAYEVTAMAAVPRQRQVQVLKFFGGTSLKAIGCNSFDTLLRSFDSRVAMGSLEIIWPVILGFSHRMFADSCGYSSLIILRFSTTD